MAFKALLICASALFVQAYGQCLAGPGLAAPGLAGAWNLGAGLGGLGAGLGVGLAGAGCGCGGVASTGGGFPATSASPIAPVGVSVLSENVYEGGLAVGGNLPFLGTVGLEGILPTAGAGAVSYGCGNGAVGIAAEEGPIVTGIASPSTFAPAGVGAIGGLAGAGLGLGLAGPAGIGYGLAGPAGIGYGLAGPAGIGYGLAGPAGIGYGLAGAGCGCGGIY